MKPLPRTIPWDRPIAMFGKPLREQLFGPGRRGDERAVNITISPQVAYIVDMLVCRRITLRLFTDVETVAQNTLVIY